VARLCVGGLIPGVPRSDRPRSVGVACEGLTHTRLFTATNELKAVNTFSLANELTTRDINADSTIDYTLAYDKAGHQTDDGKTYKYVYDAFGRLRQIKHRTTNALISEHTYNALGFRVGWHYDADADAAVDGDDPWYWFAYDDQWRIVATFRAEDADPKEVFVHHAAGLGGIGGSSHIDAVV
jgi:YD repeat-containing protein